MLAEAIDGAIPLTGMPRFDADGDRVFLRSDAVNAVFDGEHRAGKHSILFAIRNLANGGYLPRISKTVTRWPHHSDAAIKRMSGILWNPDETIPVRVVDVKDGKFTEIEKE